jgi:predicted DNA-binding transcriptional regulator AlpA
MILRETELSELGEMIRQIVRDEFQKNNLSQTEKKFVRRREACEILGGISDPTIISYEKKGLINPIRIGSTILYDRAELLNAKRK